MTNCKYALVIEQLNKDKASIVIDTAYHFS